MPAEEQARRRSQKLKAESRPLAPASAVLQGLLDDAPADQFTLVWLLGHLHRCSFGFIMLLHALFAMLPGTSYAAVCCSRSRIGDDRGLRRPCLPPSNCYPPPTNAASRAHSAAGHSGSEVSREGDPSALVHPVRGYQTRGRRLSAAANRAVTARACANDPGRTCFGDRADLTGLP